MTDATDPIDRLSSLEEEPVPAEIVLSAVRLFRYRAIATVAAVVTVALLIGVGLSLAAGRSDTNADFNRVDRDPAAIRVPLNVGAEIDGVAVTLTEYVWAEGTGYVRVIAEDRLASRPEPEIIVEVLGIESPRQAWSSFPQSSTLDLGGSPPRQVDAAWIRFDSIEAPDGYLAVEVLVLPVPRQVLDQGGELSADDGTTAVITYERNNEQ